MTAKTAPVVHLLRVIAGRARPICSGFSSIGGGQHRPGSENVADVTCKKCLANPSVRRLLAAAEGR